MIKKYYSSYTGKQIDEAVRAIVENGVQLEDFSPELIAEIKGWIADGSGGTSEAAKELVFRDRSSFPELGTEKLLYIATNDNSLHYWSETQQDYIPLKADTRTLEEKIKELSQTQISIKELVDINTENIKQLSSDLIETNDSIAVLFNQKVDKAAGYDLVSNEMIEKLTELVNIKSVSEEFLIENNQLKIQKISVDKIEDLSDILANVGTINGVLINQIEAPIVDKKIQLQFNEHNFEYAENEVRIHKVNTSSLYQSENEELVLKGGNASRNIV